jgi:hypothetical protein
MQISFKLFLVSNHSLNIKQDNGISRRYRHLQMDSKFKTKAEGWTHDDFEKKIFLKDEYFQKSITETYRAAFLHLIFMHSNKFFVNRRLPEIPAPWALEKASSEEQNDKFLEWFETSFTKGSELSIPKARLEDLMPSTLKMNVRDELKRLGIKFTYESQKKKTINGVLYKGFYVGFGEVEIPKLDLTVENKATWAACHEQLHGREPVQAEAVQAEKLEVCDKTDAELLADALADVAHHDKIRKKKLAVVTNRKDAPAPIQAVKVWSPRDEQCDYNPNDGYRIGEEKVNTQAEIARRKFYESRQPEASIGL